MKNYAYVSVLGNNEFLNAAIVLIYSWKRTKSQYPFYLIITTEITEQNKEILRSIGYSLIEIEPYRPEIYKKQLAECANLDAISIHGRDTNIGWKHYFNMFYCWSLVQFDKICWVDIDVVFIQNVDDLFNQYGDFAIQYHDHYKFDVNFIILKPNQIVFKQLLDFAEKCPPREDFQLLDGYQILTYFFKNECKQENSYIRYIVYDVRWLGTLDYDYWRCYNKIKVMHFGGTKPWMLPDITCGNIYQDYWWKEYLHILNYGIEDINNKMGLRLEEY